MVIDDFSGCMSRTAIISHLKTKSSSPRRDSLDAFASQKQTPLALLRLILSLACCWEINYSFQE